VTENTTTSEETAVAAVKTKTNLSKNQKNVPKVQLSKKPQPQKNLGNIENVNLRKHHHSNNDHHNHHNSDNNDSSPASNSETPATDSTTTETQSTTPEAQPTDQTAVTSDQPAEVTEDTTASDTTVATVKTKTNNLAMVKVNIKDKKLYCSEDCVSTCKASGFVAFSSEFLECSKVRCSCSNNNQVFRVLNSINSKSFGNLSTYLSIFALLIIFISFFTIIYYGRKKETEIKSNRKNYALLETEALDNNDNFEINEI